MPTSLTAYTPCQGKVRLSQVARCHGHSCPRRVAYGRVLDIRVMLVQNLLSTTASPLQIPLLAFMFNRHSLFL